MECTERRNAIWPRMFGPSITCNLIFCVSTIHHMKLMQRTASNYWNKSILTFNVVVLYTLLLWLLRLLLLLWQYMCMGVIYRASNISRGHGAAKFRKIHKNTQNTAKFGRNLIKYMSVQQFWNLTQLLGVFTCCKLANLCPKLPGIDYVAKKLSTSHDVKGFAIGSFLERIVQPLLEKH